MIITRGYGGRTTITRGYGAEKKTIIVSSASDIRLSPKNEDILAIIIAIHDQE